MMRFSYEWIVGEPIEERTLGASSIANSNEPDSIFTVYRVRVEARFGRSKYTPDFGPIEKTVMTAILPGADDVLVLKSGGNLMVSGVLLKKRGSLCFSELMPRRYLLGLTTNGSGRIGILEMGCRSIFAVNGDKLVPRQTPSETFTNGMQERFGNSLISFSKAFRSQH
jgi:hypothetical protein